MLLIDKIELMSYTEFVEEYRRLFEQWLWMLDKDFTTTRKQTAKQEYKSFATMYVSFNPEKDKAIKKMTREWEIAAFGGA